MPLQNCIPSPRTYATCEAISKVLSPIVISYVLKQSQEHCILGDALLFIIFTHCGFYRDLAFVIVHDSLDLEVVFN
jgi:hypothetical protein